MTNGKALWDVFVATAHQKIDAAAARRNFSPTAEAPRDAIRAALEMVADRIAPDGFSFVPSGPKFTRKAGDLTFQIDVQADRNNIAERRAAAWVHAAVYSRRLTAWRKAHVSAWVRPNAPFPIPVTSTQLGYLREPEAWVDWDFAGASTRLTVANDLAKAIQRDAGRFFSAFEEPVPNLVDRRLTEIYDPNGVYGPEGLLSYLLAIGEPARATRIAQDYFDRHPHLHAAFEMHREAFISSGIPAFRTSPAHDLAAFAVATGYPWA